MAEQNKVKLYARALAEVVLETEKNGERASAVSANFLKLIEKNGWQKQANEILELTEDILLKERGNKKIVFETARRISEQNKSLLKSFVKEGDVVKERINPELIAGVRVIVNNEKQFDNSFISKLQKIF